MSLKILEAKYGSEELKFINVTEKLNSEIKSDKLSIVSSNEFFGEDPCPEVRKELIVKYELNEEIFEETFAEGVLAQIPVVGPILEKNRIVYNFKEITLVAHCWGNNSYLTSLVWAYLQFNQSTNFAEKLFFIAENIDTREYDAFFEEESIKVIRIKYDYNLIKYSKFVVKDLNNYINTDFVLIFQNDGFISNAQAWTEEFLDYDYIGAPWWYGDENNVGNGGFSLRSKKLLEILSNDNHIKETNPEDHNICRVYGDYLREKHGIKFAPEFLAQKFSVENGRFDSQFGFHGKWHVGDYVKKTLA